MTEEIFKIERRYCISYIARRIDDIAFPANISQKLDSVNRKQSNMKWLEFYKKEVSADRAKCEMLNYITLMT